jgi:hypothetical protein
MNSRPASLVLVVVLLLLSASNVFGQSGGQFCVRAFEDRNNNQARDAGEPLLTRGVAVNLLNAEGVTIASGLLESSPTAAQGTLCFQFLPAGQYTVVVTSVELTATGAGDFSAVVSETGQPVLFEYGAQRPAAVAPTATAPTTAVEPDLARIGISAGGALLAMLGMLGLGAVIYGLFVRRPSGRDARGRLTSQRIPAVSANDDTGQMKAQR